MKDFDAGREQRNAQDRGFRIGGVEFLIVNGVPVDTFDFNEEAGDKDTITHMKRVVLAFMRTSADAERWESVVLRKDDPITYGDLKAVYEHLWEIEAEIPTLAPAASTRGRAQTPSSSGAATSLAEATAS